MIGTPCTDNVHTACVSIPDGCWHKSETKIWHGMAMSNWQSVWCQYNTCNTPIIWFQVTHERYVPRKGGEIDIYIYIYIYIYDTMVVCNRKKMQFYNIPSSCPELNDYSKCSNAVRWLHCARIWRSGGIASWSFLIIKPTSCTNFSNLFLE